MENSVIGDDRHMPDRLDHELLDAGGGRRLDRFGERIVDRPALGAGGRVRDPEAWERADLRYDRGRGWRAGPRWHDGSQDAQSPWTISMGDLSLELRPSQTGQVGVFPEHASSIAWLRRQVLLSGAEGRDRAEGGDGDDGTPGAADAHPVRVMNLFGHTGLATLALAAAGATVTHVDASRPAIAQARRNAGLSGLADRPVRWIDDAVAFVEREERRGQRYEGVILDPPAYGHAGRQPWRLEDRLDGLLRAVAAVLDPESGFVLLSAHTSGLSADTLGSALAAALGPARERIESGTLTLSARSGARLEAGWFARIGVRSGSARGGGGGHGGRGGRAGSVGGSHGPEDAR